MKFGKQGNHPGQEPALGEDEDKIKNLRRTLVFVAFLKIPSVNGALFWNHAPLDRRR